jgi:hypothetical protein
VRRLVIEHLPAALLPEDWAKRLDLSATQRVTVSIDIEKDVQKGVEENVDEATAAEYAKYRKMFGPAFGMWADREDMKDTAAYVRKIRERRFPPFEFPDDSD